MMRIGATWVIQTNGHSQEFMYTATVSEHDLRFVDMCYESIATKTIRELGATLLTGRLITHPEDRDE